MNEREAYRWAVEKLRGLAPDLASGFPAPEAVAGPEAPVTCAPEPEKGTRVERAGAKDGEHVSSGTESQSPPARPKGLGRIFQRGAVWWIAYSHRGKEFRESTKAAGSKGERLAAKLLKKRLGEIGRGRLIGPTEEKVTFESMAGDLINDYKTNGKRSMRSAELSIRHLHGSFALARAVDITTDRIRAYIADRQQDGAANASINRELAALKRMFTLAVQAGRLSTRPHIPMLDEENARQGFVSHESFLALRDALPDYLKDPVAFLYFSGWRVSEMRGLEWCDVDLGGRVIRLRPELSKNKDGRVLPTQW